MLLGTTILQWLKCHTFMNLLTIASQLAFLSLKYSKLGQSNNYDTILVKWHGSSGYKTIFRQICHIQNITTIF